MADEGLSQEDFRKLLQTPRPGGDASATPRFKAPPAKTPRREGSAVFAKPAPVKHKKKRQEQQDDDETRTSVSSQYRDRAAERRDGEQDLTHDQQTTEDLLRPMEEDETLDAKQLYEQSKYLGGDVQYTHLVKGLDFTLLDRMRRQIREKEEQAAAAAAAMDKLQEEDDNDMEDSMATVTDEQAEDALDTALDRLDRGEKPLSGSTMTMMEDALAKDVSRLSVTAKSLRALFTSTDQSTKVVVHELFRPGRMAFLFPTSLKTTNDPFAMPTAVIRSKADVSERQQSSSKTSGWSDEALQESELVLSKVAQVMVRNRELQRQEQQKKERQELQKKEQASLPTAISTQNSLVDNDADNEDDNIFSDVEGDYVLDEEAIAKEREQKQQLSDAKATQATQATQHTGYFMDNDDEVDTDMASQQSSLTSVTEALASSSSASASASSVISANVNMDSISKKRRFEAGPEDTMDADSQDIDMFGLSTTALPTSFEDRQRMVVSEDDDVEGDGHDEKSKRLYQGTLLVDQGTHKNKRAQLSRWDFDNEEQWQQYKSTVEIQPKSAAQYGVKMSDGRKRNKERRVISEKQKLNREYQQVKGIMEKKYGKS